MKNTALLLTVIFTFLFRLALAQTSNGSVSSLVAAENYFAGIAKEKGTKKAFLAVSDANTRLFKPDPVPAIKYLAKKPADEGFLGWQPVLAKISKSGNWGFTTGPYIYQPKDDSTKRSYGQYLSVWKTNRKNVWKLAIDLGIMHQKPVQEPSLSFTEPKSAKYFVHPSEKRMQQRQDILLSSDQLFSSALKNYKNLAYNVFLDENARLLFPGSEPIIGRDNINDFLRLQELKINTEPAFADRAAGSDLAYTYGTATISHKGESKNYNYVRIWEAGDDHKWNVIVELFSPAGEKS